MDNFLLAIAETMDRDLVKVISELTKYNSEENIWLNPDGITNSTGNLALHIAGNLQHFIGAVLGNTDYERDRDSEFNDRDVPKTEIIAELEKTRQILKETLNKLTDQQLMDNYPLLFPDKAVSMYYILIHLAGHLNYHLGQINYLRRLTD